MARRVQNVHNSIIKCMAVPEQAVISTFGGDLFPMVRLRRQKETVFGSKEMETGFSLIAPGVTLSVSIAPGGTG